MRSNDVYLYACMHNTAHLYLTLDRGWTSKHLSVNR